MREEGIAFAREMLSGRRARAHGHRGLELGLTSLGREGHVAATVGSVRRSWDGR
jgi:hypothetical protein